MTTPETVWTNLLPMEEAQREAATQLNRGELSRISITTSPNLAALKPSDQVVLKRPVDRIDRIEAEPIDRFRKDWTKLRRVRYDPIVIEPAPTVSTSIQAGDFILWLDPRGKRIFYSLAVPRLRSFALTIQRDASFRVTGGTAVLEVSAYPTEDPTTIEQLRKSWIGQILKQGMAQLDYETWALVPLNLRNVQGSLDVATGHINTPPQISKSSDQGRVTFLIELTAIGAQIWGDACLNQRSDTIPGVCRLSTSFYAQWTQKIDYEYIRRPDPVCIQGNCDLPNPGKVAVRQQELMIPLGTLLAPCGASVVNVLNPEISVDAKIVVDWHDALETVAVSWQPNNGAAPGSQVFQKESTPLSIVLTSQNPTALEIQWKALVTFKDPSFPTIARSGKLAFKDTNTALVLHTSSWLKQYVISVVLLDEQGSVIPSSQSAGDLANRVMGMLKFRAPGYLGDRAIDTVFEAVSQNLIKPSFPLPEGESAELELTIAAFRQSATTMQTRKLSQEETFILVKVYADARIEFITNLSETTREGDLLETLTMLEAGDYYDRPQVEGKIPGFHSASHGFHFPNNFVNHPVSGISAIQTEGLCGGMTFAALDYFYNALRIPPHTTRDFPYSGGIPAEGTRFYQFLYARQLDSFTASNLTKFGTWAIQSDAYVQSQTRYTELPLLRSQILAGKAVALGLLTLGGVSAVLQSHQVVAYGLDEDPSTGIATIYIYDSNHPDIEVTLTLNSMLSPVIASTGERWKGFFVEEYTPKLPTFMGSNEEVWSEDWSSNWTTFMPFMMGGMTHYFGYKMSTGQATLDRIKPNAHGVETLWSGTAGNWSTGWSSFVPFMLNGSPHLFAYKIGSGEVFIGKINPSAFYGVDSIWGAPAGSWTTGWSSLFSFELNGKPYLLAYKVKTGDVFIGKIRSNGQGVETIWGSTWTKGWTTFMPFVHNGQPHYLAYKVETGQVTIDRILPNGQGVETIWGSTWTKGWTTFMPFVVSGQLHYLAYKAKTGQISVDRIRPDLQGVEVVRSAPAGSWTPDWTLFVPFMLGSVPHYLGYKTTTGQVTVGLCLP